MHHRLNSSGQQSGLRDQLVLRATMVAQSDYPVPGEMWARFLVGDEHEPGSPSPRVAMPIVLVVVRRVDFETCRRNNCA